MAAQTIRWAGMRLTVDGAAEFQQKLRDVNSQLKISQGELNKVTNAFGKNEQNATTLAAKHQHLTESLNLNAERQKALNMVLDDAIDRYGENSSEVLGLRASLSEAEAEQVKLERALRETERAIRAQPWNELGDKLENAGNRMQAVGDKMQSVGRGLSLGITAPLTLLAGQALRVGADFDNSMGTIQARTGMAADEVDKLGRSFRDMAASGDYGNFTAREVAAAYANIAVHGQDAAYGTEIMRTAMVLASATGKDLGGVAYFLGNYLLKVGKDASYAEKYINLFAATNQKTGIGLDTLQDYLFRTNASLQTANISGTEATAVFGNLYQAGIRGAQAYSGMNTVIRDLISPSDDLKAIFDELGVATFDITDANRNALDVLFELADAVEENGDALLRHNLLLELGTDMGTQFADELFNQRDALRELIPELYEIAGATEGTGRAFEMAAIQQDGLAGTTALARARFEEMKLQIADNLLPIANQLMGGVSDLLARFNSLDEGTQRNIIRMAALAAAVGPVLVVGGKLTKTAGGIITTFGNMSKAIGAAGGAKAALSARLAGDAKALAAYGTAVNANTGKLKLKTKAFALASLGITKYTTVTKAASLKMTAFANGMKAKAAGMGIVKVGLTAVTAGFIKLTAAMLANPIGAIIAGVAALTAGIIALVLWIGRAGEEYKQMAEDSAEWLERQREITAAAAESAAAFEENSRSMQNNAEHLRRQAETLEYLASKSELTAGEMDRMNAIIDELNDSVDGLNLAFDEQTGALNMTAGAMEQYLAAADMQEARNAQIAELSRLNREAIDLEQEKYEAANRLLALQEKQNDGSNRNRRERNLLADAIADEMEALALLTETLEANGGMQDALTESIDVHAQALQDIKQAQEDAAAAIDETTDAMQEQKFSLEDWGKAQSDALDRISRAFESYKSIATNAFSQVSERAATSVQEMIGNLRHNTQAMEEWSKNMAILAERGVDEGLLEQLRRGGVEGAATVRELVAACDEELTELSEIFQSATDAAMEATKRAFDPEGVAQSAEELIDHVALTILNSSSMEDALVGTINNAFGSMDSTIASIGFDGLGENTVAGYVGGINSMQGDVDQAGKDTANTYLDAITGAFDMQSPSREMQKIGVNAGEGLIRGTNDIQPQVEQIARTLATAFINNVADTITRAQDINNALRRQVEDIRRTADSAVQAANFNSIGQEIANGVARGIQNGGGIVANASQNIINNALSSMRTAAQISSPSRATMRIADFMVQGIINQTQKRLKDVQRVSKELSYSFTSGLDEGFSYGLKNVGENLRHDYAEMFVKLEDIVAASGSDILQAELENFNAIITKAEIKHKQRKDLEIKHNKAVLDEAERKHIKQKILEKDAALEILDIERRYNADRVQNMLNFSMDITQALAGHHNELSEMVKRAKQDEEIIIEDSLQRQIRARLDIIDKHIRAVQDSTRDIIAEYDKQHRALIKSLDYQESEALRALQDRIDAIDAQTEAENRALREQQEQRRLADLQAAIDAAETNEDRQRATERFNDEMARQQRDAIARQRREEQTALREQMVEIRQNYSERRNEAGEQHRAAVNQAQETERTQLEFLQSLRQIEQDSFDERQKQLDNYINQKNQAIDRGHNQQKERQRRQNKDIENLVETSQRNLQNTLENYIPKWGEAGKRASQEFINSLQNNMPQFEEMGRNITQGVANGILSNGGVVSSAASSIIHNALSAMRSAAAISSPSRKTRTIGQRLMDGIASGLNSKMGELAAYCKRITDKVIDSLTIDPSEILADADSVIRSMQKALPVLESNIQQTTSPQVVAATPTGGEAPASPIHFTFGDVYVREDSDIDKLANAILRKLGKDVDKSGKIKGVRLV